MADLNLAQQVDAYFDEWLKAFEPRAENETEQMWRKRRAGSLLSLQPRMTGLIQFTNPECSKQLSLAAELLLDATSENRRVAHSTAVQALAQAHIDHLPEAKATGVLSEEAVIERAKKIIAATERSSGTYVFGACLTPNRRTTELRVGPATVLSKLEFDSRYGPQVEAMQHGGDFDRDFYVDWKTFSARFDHFILVEIEGHEKSKAWAGGREIAEFVLNLVRVSFGFRKTQYVRLGGDFLRQTSSAHLFISEESVINGSWARTYVGDLGEDWPARLRRQLGSDGHFRMLEGYASWLAAGHQSRTPIFERLSYANALIAQTYSEPHEHIRLVRLTSALETLAVLSDGKRGRRAKATPLAERCAWVSGWSSEKRQAVIRDAVAEAYKLRNDVVHGDAPRVANVRAAFQNVDREMLAIFMGFMTLFSVIQSQEPPPRDVAELHRAMNTFGDAHAALRSGDVDVSKPS